MKIVNFSVKAFYITHVKISTIVIRPLKFYNLLPQNVKRIIHSRDAKCENVLRGSGLRPKKSKKIIFRLEPT